MHDEKEVHVKIIGDHPWAGHTGILTGKTTKLIFQTEYMLEIQIDDHPDVPYGHRCFAGKKDLRLIEASS